MCMCYVTDTGDKAHLNAVCSGSVEPDKFYLPIRVSKVLNWCNKCAPKVQLTTVLVPRGQSITKMASAAIGTKPNINTD